MFARNKIAMPVAEFLGTAFLTLVVLGVQRSTLGLPYFIAIAAGVTVAFAVYVFGSVSGAQLNPALTLGLWTARRIKTIPAVLFIAAQLLGGWAAYAVYHYFVNTQVQAIHSTFSARIMLAEALGAMIFSFGWSAAAYNRYETNRFASAAGLSFALGILIASAASVGIINPAVALGARAWIWGTYVLGPVVGAVVGVNLYGLLFAPVEAVVSASSTAAAEAERPKVANKATPVTAKPVNAKRVTTRNAAAVATAAKKKPVARRGRAPKKV